MFNNKASNNRKQTRIDYVKKLNVKLADVAKCFEQISFNVPEELDSTKELITEILDLIEDVKPFDSKNFTKLKQRMLESESMINKLTTELKDLQFKGILNQTRIKEIDKELQFHNQRIKDYKQYQQQSPTTITLGTSPIQQQSLNNLNKPYNTPSSPLSKAQLQGQSSDSSNSLAKLKSTSNQLQQLITRIYSTLDKFKLLIMQYFDMVRDIVNKIPELRGGLDIGGLVNIGGDEAVEILERMNNYIYQSSKQIFNFINELPNLDSNWYKFNINNYNKIILNLENSNPNKDNDSNNSNNNNSKKIKDLDILKPHKFIIDVFKKKQRDLNLIEKISNRETDKIKDEQIAAKNKNRQPKDHNGRVMNDIKNPTSNQNTTKSNQKKYTNEPLSSIFYQIDAIVADIMNFMKFPDKDILSNLLLPMESKCKMLSEVLVNFQSRFQYYQEKIQVWLDYNSTIQRVTSYESDPSGFVFDDLKSLSDMQSKLKILLKVMNSHMTVCPIATPMVYPTEGSWKLISYPEFRSEQRRQISELLITIKSNNDPIDIDTLRKCTLIFTEIFINVLNIQIPLMIDVFEDDSTLFKTKNWSNERKLMLGSINNTIHSLKYVSTTESQILIDLLNNSIKMLVSVMLQYFQYKPIARPNVYKSDSLWKLVNESKLRYEYRTSILI